MSQSSRPSSHRSTRSSEASASSPGRSRIVDEQGQRWDDWSDKEKSGGVSKSYPHEHWYGIRKKMTRKAQDEWDATYGSRTSTPRSDITSSTVIPPRPTFESILPAEYRRYHRSTPRSWTVPSRTSGANPTVSPDRRSSVWSSYIPSCGTAIPIGCIALPLAYRLYHSYTGPSECTFDEPETSHGADSTSYSAFSSIASVYTSLRGGAGSRTDAAWI